MPIMLFILMLLSVIVAGGATVWIISLGGPAALMIALPVYLIAAVAVRWRRE